MTQRRRKASKGADDTTERYLTRLEELDTTAAGLLKSRTTKATAKAMILRERREIAILVARVQGVDVDGKREPLTPPGAGNAAPQPTGLFIDLSNVPAELVEKIVARHAEKTEAAN